MAVIVGTCWHLLAPGVTGQGKFVFGHLFFPTLQESLLYSSSGCASRVPSAKAMHVMSVCDQASEIKGFRWITGSQMFSAGAL
mmetsp:Transcript_55332/g.121008  ORF Transcript_55332/g.121008 Transcript_55332/m.121008 type:complete len:83 (-) Transcript_55332:177-425(-)